MGFCIDIEVASKKIHSTMLKHETFLTNLYQGETMYQQILKWQFLVLMLFLGTKSQTTKCKNKWFQGIKENQ